MRGKLRGRDRPGSGVALQYATAVIGWRYDAQLGIRQAGLAADQEPWLGAGLDIAICLRDDIFGVRRFPLRRRWDWVGESPLVSRVGYPESGGGVRCRPDLTGADAGGDIVGTDGGMRATGRDTAVVAATADPPREVAAVTAAGGVADPVPSTPWPAWVSSLGASLTS